MFHSYALSSVLDTGSQSLDENANVHILSESNFSSSPVADCSGLTEWILIFGFQARPQWDPVCLFGGVVECLKDISKSIQIQISSP